MAALMSCALHVGCAWRVSAADPATCGEAIDVPERISPPLPVPLAVDRTLTPGAERSGFRALSPLRGPPELNDANFAKFGLGISAGVTVAGVPSASARNFAPSVAPVGGPATPRNGIVTVKGTPSSGFDVILPSNGGN